MIGDNKKLNTPSSRLKHVRMLLGKSGEEFGSRIGLSKNAISQREIEKVPIEERDALVIQHMWLVSKDWLMEGKGPIWAQDQASQAVFPGKVEGGFVYRPLIEGAATCGAGGEIDHPGPMASLYALREDFARRILSRCGGGQNEDLFFLLCRGESMVPTIRDKEIVLINAALAIRMDPKPNGIYLVRRDPNDGEARVKRLRLDTARGQLLLGSDNRAFPTLTVDLDQVPLHQLILGRVVWVGRYLLDSDPPEGDW